MCALNRYVAQCAPAFAAFHLLICATPCSALLKHWVGLLYGLVAILGITPCLGFGVLALPFQPPEFATGLALFCVVPTTLGVGVALTAASKGNQALALLLTVATNLLGIVTVGGSDTLMHRRHVILSSAQLVLRQAPLSFETIVLVCCSS
jgi:ACR3 family arsenite efflux pump ArsB